MLKTDVKQLIGLADLLCTKIGQSTDIFMERVNKRRSGKFNECEYIEKMYLEPTDMQIRYLSSEIILLCERIANDSR